MNSNNHLNPINYSDTPNVLLLGNGINRAFDTGSWSDLLDDMSCNGYREEEREALKEIPYSLQAMVMTGDNVDEGVKHIAEKLIVTDNIDDEQRGLIRRLLSSHFDAVLTTNYTYDIEKSINLDFNCNISSRSKYRFSSMKNATRKEKQFGLYRYMNVDQSGTFPNIWHIHGEAGLPDSMVIGHYFFM